MSSFKDESLILICMGRIIYMIFLNFMKLESNLSTITFSSIFNRLQGRGEAHRGISQSYNGRLVLRGKVSGIEVGRL